MDINFLGERDIKSSFTEDPTATLTARTFSQDELGLFKYARLLVYILVFLVPLFFLPWTSDFLEFNKQFLIFSLSGAGLLLYLAQVIRTGHLIIKRSPANYVVLVFLGAVLLVSFFSDFRYQSLFGGFGAGFQESLLTSVSFVIFFFLVLNIFGVSQDSSRKDMAKLLNIFGLSLFLTLLLGFLQAVGVPVFKLFKISQQSFNTVGTVNSLGIIAAILLVFSLSKSEAEGKKNLFTYLRFLALLLSLFFLLLLNWWVLWLTAIAGLVLSIVSNSLRSWRISNYFWPAAIILLAVVFMLLNFNLASSIGFNLPLEIAPSFRASFGIAKDVLVKDPLFGVGPENFPLAYDLYKPLSINNTAFWNVRFSEATSEFFNVLISYGFVGLAAFGLLLWAGFRFGFKNFNLFPLFSVLVAAWVLYPYNITIGFAFWFLFSLLVLSGVQKDDELIINLEKSPRHSLVTSVSSVGVLVAVIAGFYFLTLGYIANVKFVKALGVQDSERQTQLLVEAINLRRNEDMYSQALANLLVSRVNQEVQNLNTARSESERQAVISRIQNFSATAINISSEITQRHKENSPNWLSRALVYESLINIVDGADQWAIRMYDEYSNFSPKNPLPYLKKGSIYLTRADSIRQLIFGQGNANLRPEDRVNFQNQIADNLKMAEENYQKAIELKSNYALAIYSLGVVYEREGRIKDAIRQVEITRSANPLDANITFQLGLLYYRDNQKDKSFNELQRAVTIFPDFSNARWYLALLYEERGELNNALGQLYRVRESNPNHEILNNKIKELERGKRSIPPEKVTGFQPLEENQGSQ